MLYRRGWVWLNEFLLPVLAIRPPFSKVRISDFIDRVSASPMLQCNVQVTVPDSWAQLRALSPAPLDSGSETHREAEPFRMRCNFV